MSTTKTIARTKPKSGATGLYLIGVYKLIEGFALAALGFGLLRLLHRDLSEEATHLVRVLRADPDNHFIHGILQKIFAVSPKQLRELSVGTFLYAALRLVEGFGLMAKKLWAEYLTVIMTAVFIPLELFEIWRHFTALKIIFLLVNVAIVWYLIVGLRKTISASRHS